MTNLLWELESLRDDQLSVFAIKNYPGSSS